MQDQVAVLLELRQVDDELRAMRAGLEARAADLQRKHKEADAVREALTREKDRLAAAEARHREGDREADNCRERKKKFETDLSSIKNNTEYHAMLKQIAAQEQKAREWEDVALQMMEVEEELQKTIARVAGDLR